MPVLRISFEKVLFLAGKLDGYVVYGHKLSGHGYASFTAPKLQFSMQAPHLTHLAASMVKGCLMTPDMAFTGQLRAHLEQPLHTSGSMYMRLSFGAVVGGAVFVPHVCKVFLAEIPDGAYHRVACGLAQAAEGSGGYCVRKLQKQVYVLLATVARDYALEYLQHAAWCLRGRERTCRRIRSA